MATPAYTGPLSKIELRLSGHNLKNLDVLSKSDPQVIVQLKGKNGIWNEIGRTEVINDNLNPAWVTPIIVGNHSFSFHYYSYFKYNSLISNLKLRKYWILYILMINFYYYRLLL